MVALEHGRAKATGTSNSMQARRRRLGSGGAAEKHVLGNLRSKPRRRRWRGGR